VNGVGNRNGHGRERSERHVVGKRVRLPAAADVDPEGPHQTDPEGRAMPSAHRRVACAESSETA